MELSCCKLRRRHCGSTAGSGWDRCRGGSRCSGRAKHLHAITVAIHGWCRPLGPSPSRDAGLRRTCFQVVRPLACFALSMMLSRSPSSMLARLPARLPVTPLSHASSNNVDTTYCVQRLARATAVASGCNRKCVIASLPHTLCTSGSRSLLHVCSALQCYDPTSCGGIDEHSLAKALALVSAEPGFEPT